MSTSTPATSIGVLPSAMVRKFAFAVISAAIFACTVICLLAVWDVAGDGSAWKALTSLGIITGGVLAFLVANEVFGLPVTSAGSTGSSGSARPALPAREREED